MMWPTLGPELSAKLWQAVVDQMPAGGVTVTQGPPVAGRRQVRAKRGQAPTRMDI